MCVRVCCYCMENHKFCYNQQRKHQCKINRLWFRCWIVHFNICNYSWLIWELLRQFIEKCCCSFHRKQSFIQFLVVTMSRRHTHEVNSFRETRFISNRKVKFITWSAVAIVSVVKIKSEMRTHFNIHVFDFSCTLLDFLPIWLSSHLWIRRFDCVLVMKVIEIAVRVSEEKRIYYHLSNL